MPNVNGVVDFEQFISGFEVDQFDLCVVLWEEDQSVLVADIAKQFESVSSVCLVIGPEGGITRNEIDKLVSDNISLITIEHLNELAKKIDEENFRHLNNAKDKISNASNTKNDSEMYSITGTWNSITM